MRFLLDVNVLVALSFLEHASHVVAQEWFQEEPLRLWASCPLTQAGFLRVAYVQTGRTRQSLRVALASLEQNCLSPGHEFWNADVDLRDLTESQRSRLIGHNQIADMQLLKLAYRHGGQVATLDAGIQVLAEGTRYASSVTVL